MLESNWTEEEVRYIKALLAWGTSDDEDGDIGGSCVPERSVEQFTYLILGAEGCGKTSLLERFCYGTFAGGSQFLDSDEVERGYHHTVRVEDRTYMFNALELPSRYLLVKERLKEAAQITDAAVLVYDVGSRASFTLLLRVYNHIRETVEGTRMYGFALVGTNSDCEDKKREVSWDEGQKLAQSLEPGCSFLETSAKTGENIDRVFLRVGERTATQQHSAYISSAKGVARWRSWARSWLKRRVGERKISAPY